MKHIKKFFSFIIEIVKGVKQTKLESRQRNIGA
jgi:hypothetical protein